MLIDSFQRKIEYLRLSVTELCNIRCAYCMPVIPPSPPLKLRGGWGEILTFEEIIRMVRILAPLGVRRVRLTGGEPLVRKNLPDLIRRLWEVSDIREVLLTTNGILLKSLAKELKEAGLRKINIHLDTLSPEKFKEITRWGDIQKVFDGIQEAQRLGFSPIKLNAVICRGVNDHEAEDLLKFAAENDLILRFIELMPIGPAREMMSTSFIPLEKISERLQEKYTLDVSGKKVGSGPALYYKVRELKTLVGFISPVSQPFCRSCNRIRISSDGRFQDCLAYDGSFSLRDLLRNPGFTDEMISGEVISLLQGKRESHNNFTQAIEERTPCMYGIGG